MKQAIALLLFAGISTVALAQTPVSIPNVVPYADDSVGSDAMRKECDWNTKLSTYIVDYSKGGAVAVEPGSASSDGRFLVMSITNVHAVGGGGFSGPKWATVHGELHDGVQVIGSFTAMRDTSSGGMFSTCSVLSKISKAIGHDIAEWLKAPTMDAKLGNAR